MSYKTKLWVGAVVITLICFIDYQFFTEGRDARRIAPLIRQAAHLVILAAIIPVGYWSWKAHPMQWTKQVWLRTYLAALFILIIVGLIQWQTHLFSNEILDRFYDFRIFFGSPLAFIVLYMLTVIAKKKV